MKFREWVFIIPEQDLGVKPCYQKGSFSLNFGPKLSTNKIAAFFKFKYLENPLLDFHNFSYGNIKQREEQNGQGN